MSLEKAKEIYNDICSYFDENKLIYNKYDDRLMIEFRFSSDDLPVFCMLFVDPERELIILHSPLPFKFDESKRIQGAIATCYITNKIVDGSFDYNIKDGGVCFRITATFRNSRIGKDLFDYLFNYSDFAVDEFNDKLFAVNKGYMTIEEFIEE